MHPLRSDVSDDDRGAGRDRIGDGGVRPIVSSCEQSFHGDAEDAGDPQRGIDAGRVASGFDGPERLTGDPGQLGQLRLAEPVAHPRLSNTVSHESGI